MRGARGKRFLKKLIILSLLLFISGVILGNNVYAENVHAGKKGHLKKKRLYHGKLLGRTELFIGGAGKVLNGGTGRGNSFLGYAGLFKFPLNSFIDWRFWGAFLKADNGTLKKDYYAGKVGPLIHFLPHKIVDPYLHSGVLFCKQKDKKANDTASGSGWFIELGTEILLGKYAALRVYGSYLKETLRNKDEGWSGGILINSCYKWICFYLKSEYTSSMKIWEDSESIDIEAGLGARFSIVKFLKLIEEDLTYEVEEDEEF
jgi:hypothetical protein